MLVGPLKFLYDADENFVSLHVSISLLFNPNPVEVVQVFQSFPHLNDLHLFFPHFGRLGCFFGEDVMRGGLRRWGDVIGLGLWVFLGGGDEGVMVGVGGGGLEVEGDGWFHGSENIK